MSCKAHPSTHEEACAECRVSMWMAAAQMSAASAARACDIILAADKLAEVIEKVGERHFAIRAALDAFKVVRNGQ